MVCRQSVLLEAVQQFITQHGLDKTYWLAYSGGLDSHVLLHAFASLREQHPIQLKAIHVHHGLSPNADDWVKHCEMVCKSLHVELVCESVGLSKGKDDSLEALARDARYTVFAARLAKGDVLLTAHHADDQAETVLLQLLRGAGVKGLSAMPAIKPFAIGFHARPLLNVSKEALEDYAKTLELDWVEDESNRALDFSRNYLRHQVMPDLKARWPAAADTFLRSSVHCASAQILLDEYADLLCDRVKGSTVNTLSVASLLMLSDKQQRLVLRRWIEQQGYLLPDNKKLSTILNNMLLAAEDRYPCVIWGEVSVRRYRGELRLVPVRPEEAAQQPSRRVSACQTSPRERVQIRDLPQITLASHQEMIWQLPNGRYLCARQVQGQGLVLSPDQLSVASRQGGERIRVAGGGRRSLKNLFQEGAVPSWERARMPLLYWQNQLVAIVGLIYDQGYVVKSDEPGWVFYEKNHSPGYNECTQVTSK